jgi:type IV fimbrial biogenesis protein FimT
MRNTIIVLTVEKGFTLIELMITVAIMSIMLTIGLPSFQSIIASSRLTASANAMVSALQLARFEALKQHKSVTIRKTGAAWQDGWDVFVDNNGNGSFESANDEKLVSYDKLSSAVTVTGNGYASYASYDASGRINTVGNFLFKAQSDCRKVVIAATGRIRVETPSSCS